jgi:hypothetical protein
MYVLLSIGMCGGYLVYFPPFWYVVPRKNIATQHNTELSFPNRVTRLGEFSPIGWLFLLGSYLRITEVAHIFGLLYSSVKFKNKCWQKIGWATFWAIFSQPNLVTLFPSDNY